MKKIIILFLLISCSGILYSQSGSLNSYRWKNRIILLFGSGTDPSFARQLAELKTDPEGIKERHLLLFQISEDQVDQITGDQNGPMDPDILRQQYDINDGEFRYILIGKDGGVKLDKKGFVPNDYLYNIIDAMPMRRQEMKKQRKPNGQ